MKRSNPETPTPEFEDASKRFKEWTSGKREKVIRLLPNEKPSLPGRNKYKVEYVNGKPSRIFEAIGEKIDGLCFDFFPSGRVKSMITYVLGRKNGSVVENYDNGVMKYSMTFKNDKLDGKILSFYKNSRPEDIQFFVNGLREGKSKGFHENGNIRYVGEFKNGLKNGYWKNYSDRGFETSCGYYVDGLKDGEWKEFHDLQMVASIKNYKNGKLHGKSIIFSKNGKPITSRNYLNGVLDGMILDYYAGTDVLNRCLKIKNNIFVGEQKLYFTNGSLGLRITNIVTVPRTERVLGFISFYSPYKIVSYTLETFDEKENLIEKREVNAEQKTAEVVSMDKRVLCIFQLVRNS